VALLRKSPPLLERPSQLLKKPSRLLKKKGPRPELFAQLQRERLLIECVGVQSEDRPPAALAGGLAKQAEKERRSASAKKGHETRKTREAKEREEAMAAERKQRELAREAPDYFEWIAWFMSQGKIDLLHPDGQLDFSPWEPSKGGEVTGLERRLAEARAKTSAAAKVEDGKLLLRFVEGKGGLPQKDIAVRLSFMLGTNIGQQRVSEIIQKVENWQRYNFPDLDHTKLITGSKRETGWTQADIEKYVTDARRVWLTGPREHRLKGRALEPPKLD